MPYASIGWNLLDSEEQRVNNGAPRIGGVSMLIEAIDTYLRQTKTAPTRFGRDVVGDPNFVLNLRDGRRPRKRTVTRVMRFIEARGASNSTPHSAT